MIAALSVLLHPLSSLILDIYCNKEPDEDSRRTNIEAVPIRSISKFTFPQEPTIPLVLNGFDDKAECRARLKHVFIHDLFYYRGLTGIV